LCVLLCHVTPAAFSKCARPEPLCSYYWKPPLIFLGHVDGMQLVCDHFGERLENGLTVRDCLVSHYRVELAVAGSFRGDAGKRIIVEAGGRPVEDAFDFQEGGDYLVYAYKSRSGEWATNSCTRTHRIKVGAEDADLKWIRDLATAPAGALIYGSISKPSVNRQAGSMSTASPVSGIEVNMTGPVFRTVVSDSEGKFSAPGLPPGRYTVAVDTPTVYTAFPPGPVEVVDRGCAEVQFYAQ